MSVTVNEQSLRCVQSFAIKLRVDTPISRRRMVSFGPYLQGVLMSLIDTEYASFLHSTATNPYTQYVSHGDTERDIIWHISTLSEEAHNYIGTALINHLPEKILLKTPNMTLHKISVSHEINNFQEIVSTGYKTQSTNRFNITFKTPTAFKQSGQFINLPDTRLILQSAAMKFARLVEHADLDEEILTEFSRSVRLTQYRCQSQPFRIASTHIPAFIGNTTLSVYGAPTFISYVAMLLQFSQYAGIGVKTSMGMGAISVQKIERQKV